MSLFRADNEQVKLLSGRAQHARTRSQQGAVMVEAAMVLPVMILIVVGIIEFGMLFTSYSTSTASTRSGARLAATAYAQAGSVASAQNAALTQIALSSAADLKVLTNGTPVGMAVYKVNPAATDGAPFGGYPGDAVAGGCSSSCVKFTWNPTTKTMTQTTGSWTNADACGVTVDTIGVFVQVQHKYITAFFGSNRTVTGHTVMRLEPLPSDQCPGG